MRSMFTILLFLPLSAAFETSLISGQYTLSAGSCPSPITISQNSTTLSAGTITLNNNSCNTSITLNTTPANYTALHNFLSKTPQIGSFLTTNQNLTCGNSSVTSITLFETSKEVTLPANRIPAIKNDFVLKEGFVFLATNKCLFQREKPDDEGIVQQILNTVQECLPGDALINTETGLKKVSKLAENEVVATTQGLQPILTWTHRDHEPFTRLTQIRFEGSNTSLELTSGHYVFTDRGLLPAGSVRSGMVMESGKGGLMVRAVGTVMKWGLFNPHTAAGDLLVGADGIRISCYTSAVEPVVAHALLVPVRGGFMMHGEWLTGFGNVVERLVERFRYSGIVGWLSA